MQDGLPIHSIAFSHPFVTFALEVKFLDRAGALSYMVAVAAYSNPHFSRVPAFLAEGASPRTGDNNRAIRVPYTGKLGHFSLFAR